MPNKCFPVLWGAAAGLGCPLWNRLSLTRGDFAVPRKISNFRVLTGFYFGLILLKKGLCFSL